MSIDVERYITQAPVLAANRALTDVLGRDPAAKGTAMIEALRAALPAILAQHRADVLEETGIPVKAEWLAKTTVSIQRVRDLHRPFAIYAECGHDHTPDDPGVLVVDDIGLTCNKVYDICRDCCMYGRLTWRGQSEECASEHDHGPRIPICSTLLALDGEA